MAQAKLRVTLTRRLPAETEIRLAELFELQLNETDAQMTPEALIAAGQNCDVICPSLGDTLDGAFFAATRGVKLVASFGAGYDHIDLAAARNHGVTVTNTPSVLAEDAADMCMALILAVPRRLVEGVDAMTAGRFTGWSPTWMLGSRVRGKRLGIIGLGRVGQHVARRARAFGLDIHYHNRTPINPHLEAELEATYWPSLDGMMQEVNIVSIHCPHTPETYNLLSYDRLSRLPRGSYVVNISRGEMIKEQALVALIESGHLAGAALDVFKNEPKVNPILAASPNVILLPHMASATHESRQDMGQRMLINIKMFADGHKPPDRIIPEVI